MYEIGFLAHTIKEKLSEAGPYDCLNLVYVGQHSRQPAEGHAAVLSTAKLTSTLYLLYRVYKMNRLIQLAGHL